MFPTAHKVPTGSGIPAFFQFIEIQGLKLRVVFTLATVFYQRFLSLDLFEFCHLPTLKRCCRLGPPRPYGISSSHPYP